MSGIFVFCAKPQSSKALESHYKKVSKLGVSHQQILRPLETASAGLENEDELMVIEDVKQDSFRKEVMAER